MKPLTIVTPFNSRPFFEKILHFLAKSALVEYVVIVSPEPVPLKIPKGRVLVAKPPGSDQTLNLILSESKTPYLLFLPEAKPI